MMEVIQGNYKRVQKKRELNHSCINVFKIHFENCSLQMHLYMQIKVFC